VSEPFLGEIRIFGFNFQPRGWALCNGQLLPISQNTALFSLLGTQYGGDGIQTFALPDLRSRVPLHMGQGPGLSNYFIGEQTGAESVALNADQLPTHNHAVMSTRNAASKIRADNNLPARTTANSYAPASDGSTMNPSMIANAGSGAPVDNVQPILALNFCIALQGIFPSRN
jgi:microcystin-dependent protein